MSRRSSSSAPRPGQPHPRPAARGFEGSDEPLALDAAARERLAAGAEPCGASSRRASPSYGINTGFGKLAQTHIADDQLELLQRNLVLSHSVGVGAAAGDAVVRLVMLLKVASLARGYSGVRPQLVDALLALLNAGVYPCIPSKGSVGASGDLAPLAHMAAVLLGVGEARHRRRAIAARRAGAARAGLAPLALAPKEGLALLNGTQVSTALALHGLFAAREPVRRRAWSPARCRWTPPWAATRRSTRASTSCAASRGRSRRPRSTARCSPGASIRASHLTGDDKVQDPVLPALPAAGDGRLPRRDATPRR